jgi:hypothetical protein
MFLYEEAFFSHGPPLPAVIDSALASKNVSIFSSLRGWRWKPQKRLAEFAGWDFLG